MLSCSKGSRGLFVPSRVIGIFTDTTISLGSRLRQCPDHYTIRAGRNLPDKEFRYLRTVIVTACIPLLSNSHSPVFLLNSCLDLFAAPHLFSEDPFSRSYGADLPSSLTVSLPSALVYSTRPRVSVYGTVVLMLEFSGFSWKLDYRRYRLPPKRTAYCRASAHCGDLPPQICTFALQPPFPSGGGRVTSPSPRHTSGQ